jgi:hypothetical protein
MKRVHDPKRGATEGYTIYFENRKYLSIIIIIIIVIIIIIIKYEKQAIPATGRGGP